MKTVAKLVAIARDGFRAGFTLPAMAPGYAERAKRVSAALEHFHQFVLRLAGHHGIRGRGRALPHGYGRPRSQS